MTTDTTEKGLETLIIEAMTGTQTATASVAATGAVAREPLVRYGGTGWILGHDHDFSPEFAIDLPQLTAFIADTQPLLADAFSLEHDSQTRRKFLARLQTDIAKRGVIAVLLHGIAHGQHNLNLFYGTPTPGNTTAIARFSTNRFSVTRQLHYSKGNPQLSLDICLFINGLPVVTFELKNSLTKQTAKDAVEQYKTDRDPRELLFQFARCAVHFAVDDNDVFMCSHLKGKASWFMPFNQGCDDGACNPPNPAGIKTDYLWKRILTPQGLTDIVENYARIVKHRDEQTGSEKPEQIFPRYHQLDSVRKLLSDAAQQGVGQRYLIEHSAGSGKSNSIAWLARQLITLRKDDAILFDSIIVVTDRRILDSQINATIKGFTQMASTVAHAENAGGLRAAITQGRKIIISTVQKFPHILDEIGSEHRNRRFAIIIDEAHSSQGGRTTAALNRALAVNQEEGDDDEVATEDLINELMESHKMLPNASYFAFTATPKNKTLEIFGAPFEDNGSVKHRPFHTYSMKQAIQEGFILDVLQNYTPVASYYKLAKKIEDDPEFDTRRAQKKLRRYVENHEHAISLKAEIMVDHLLKQVIGASKIGGKARAMVVTSGVELAIKYYDAIQAYLQQLKSPYKAIVAFSGERNYGGVEVTEASINGFPSSQIADKIKEDPYRILICADKFQTGYDEPFMHTMYVDKVLSGIKAVQTLSRLNRAHPLKHDTFVLDFMNDTEMIRLAFADYYRTTILSAETDPNMLHDLKNDLDGSGVYTIEQIEALVSLYLNGVGREKLDPILDVCVVKYKELNQDLKNEDSQVQFKGNAKAFVRTYAFLSAILPYTNADWEKLSIFLNFLIRKLPAPNETDLARGILEAIDMDSYRTEKQAVRQLILEDKAAEIDPVPDKGGGHKPGTELDRLSNIIKEFNERFGNVAWNDGDLIQRTLFQDAPAKVAADTAYQNAMKYSDKQAAQIEHDNAMRRVIVGLMKDHADLFKLYMDNEPFRRYLNDTSFALTYQQPPQQLHA